MYICSCHAVTDHQIKQAVKDGVKNFRGLCKKTGCATQCGICARNAKEIFDEAKRAQGAAETGDESGS